MSDLLVGQQEQWMEGYKTAKREDIAIIAKEIKIAANTHRNSFLGQSILTILKRLLKSVEENENVR